MEEKEYEYKRLNIKNGDIINDYHINYLQDAISKISSESKYFKNNLVNILKEKSMDVSNEDTFKDLLSKVNSLQSSPERIHDEEWPDISDNIESGHIRLLIKTGVEIAFWLKPSSDANFIIDWGNGSKERLRISINGQTVRKNISGTGLATIDISLDTEDSRIEIFASADANSSKNILWFCSKDIFFTNGYGMFTGRNQSGGLPCENLKYIDFIGGGVNGDISYFAKNCKKLERVTGNLNPNGYNANSAFESCLKLKDLPILNLNGAKSVDYLFYKCESITTFPYYINNNGSITSANYMFQDCRNLVKFYSDQEFDFSIATSQATCFYNCSSLTISPKIKFGSGNAGNFYSNCTSLRNLNQEQDTFDLQEVTNVSGFFQNCSNLIDGPSKFLAPKATTVTNLFNGCSNIQNVPDSLIFPMATTAEYLFKDCYNLRTAPNTINLPLATNIREMFKNCNMLLTPPTLINAESAKEAYDLFHSCNSLRETPNTIKLLVATNIQGMFYNCTSITTGPDILQAPMAANAINCFYQCRSLINAGRNFEIGNKNPGNCTFSSFFQSCISLKTLPTEGDMHKGNLYNSFFMYAGNIDYDSLERFCNIGLDFPFATSLNSFFHESKCVKIPSIKAIKCTTATNLFQTTQNCDSIGDINLPSCTAMQYLFNNAGQSLLNIGKINLKSLTTNSLLYIDNLRYIKKLTISGLRIPITLNNASNLTSIELEEPNADFIGNLQFNNCKLDVDALNSLLDSLPDVNFRNPKPSIQIKGNPGTNDCNSERAESNGWTVTK